MAKQTVLIIEDDEYLDNAENDCQRSRFSGADCPGWLSALELYQQHLPEVVLLDINLPQLNGYSFASLSEIFDHKPRVIVVTSTPANYEQHLKELADGCLVKPIKRQALLGLLA